MTEHLMGKEFFEEGHLPIAVFRQFADFNREPHSHDFYEVMIVTGGVAVHHFGEQHQTISMGDLFVIPPGHVHSYNVEENSAVQVVNLLFDLEALEINPRDLKELPGFHALFSVGAGTYDEPHLKLGAKELAFVSSVVDQIEMELEEEAPGHQFFCGMKLRELMVFLSRRYSHVTAPAGKNFLKLSQLVSYMEKHLGEELQFENLAAEASMSPSSLRRVFGDAFGCSPMTYLQKLRVKKAMLLLNDQSRSISAVAFEVGFNDSGYFTSVFKKETGETPKRFRENL
jgi:AraC-like DNA-binding protein